MADADTIQPVCWGCECGLPVIEGYHREPTNIPDTVYVYPCKAIPKSTEIPHGDTA